MSAPSVGHALILNLVSKTTGDVEGQISFSSEEVQMPGYVAHVELDYHGTPWRIERVWVVNAFRDEAKS